MLEENKNPILKGNGFRKKAFKAVDMSYWQTKWCVSLMSNRISRHSEG